MSTPLCIFTKERSVQNLLWPPIQSKEPELPTASPLYFPPSSLLHVHIKECVESKSESDYQPLNEEEVNNIMEQNHKLSICSAEVASVTGRRTAAECIEAITETLDTQLLVESVLQKRPNSPPPLTQDISVEATIRIPESDIKSSTKLTQTTVEVKKNDIGDFKRPTNFTPNTLEYEIKTPSPKIVNAVPKKWESPLLVALKTVPDSCADEESVSKMPFRRPANALLSALTVAPSVPFTPAQPATFEPVELPEYTEPYLPPERSITLLKAEEKQERFIEQPPPPYSPFVKALQIAPERPYTPVPENPVRKKKQKEDPLFKDLPKPEKELTMREALAIAPEVPCAPLISEISVKFDNAKALGLEHQEVHIKQETQELQKPLKPNTLPASFQVPLVSPPKPFVSKFPPISDQLKLTTNTEKQQSTEVNSINETVTEEANKCTIENRSQTECTTQQTIVQNFIEKQNEDVVYKKPLPLASSLRPVGALPQYQVNLSENVEMELLMLEKQEMLKAENERSSSVKSQKVTEQTFTNKPTIIIQTENPQPLQKPIITIQPENGQHLSEGAAFQPVVEDRPPSINFSPRPRPLTPSMINKPAPTLPHYQANLVAQRHAAPETNLFDPMSPSISRSPSPCPEARSTSPFRPPSATRAPSPAPGPPPNPLKSKDPLPTPQSLKVEEAKRSLSSFIPHHKEKMNSVQQIKYEESGKVYESEKTVSNKAQPLPKPIQFTQNYNDKDSNQQTNTCSLYPQQREFYREEVIQKTKDGQEKHSRAYNSSSANAQHEFKIGDATTRIAEQQSMKHLEQSNKSESQSVKETNEGRTLIERKKTITEEFEHIQKSKVVQVERNTGANYPFHSINVSAIEEQQGIMGLHVTNPQPIASPFISAEKNLSLSKKELQTPIKPQLQFQARQQDHIQHNFEIQNPQTKTPALLVKQSNLPSSNPKAIPSSIHCVDKPNIPVPNSGVGGGRQAGAIGVAPKRGRGVLNAAVLGSRIPLCGHCHSYIRYRTT